MFIPAQLTVTSNEQRIGLIRQNRKTETTRKKSNKVKASEKEPKLKRKKKRKKIISYQSDNKYTRLAIDLFYFSYLCAGINFKDIA